MTALVQLPGGRSRALHGIGEAIARRRLERLPAIPNAAYLMLTNSVVSLVDADMLSLLCQWRWQLNRGGYAWRHARQDGKNINIFVHRVVMGLEYGDSREVDHIDGNKLDNRRSNLRIVSSRQQSQNLAAHGRSKYRGVSFHRHSGLWRAEVRVKGVRYSAGYYENEADAGKAAAKLRASVMTHANEARHPA